MDPSMSMACLRDSQTSFTFYQTPYQSGLHDTHGTHAMSGSTVAAAVSASMIWSPFQTPTPADRAQRKWHDDGQVKMSTGGSNWKTKRVTIVAPALPQIPSLQTTLYSRLLDDPPSIHLELSDCSICTPIFEDREI
ncbi:hypothetical protein GL50803_0027141 [Giardia duodenalis]|uniref:Uncharacterized protein n=2 Tax=Giardia intestinalis TaxID=5741 RepID=A8BHE1_GIAIC|nr:hypothetical protein GL50803_0027141 [Giardia intestinalis]KAE8301658.1 hypothetical protein GL50803_0027141 [Giardia intestinalis]|eukprot:XP_001707089.1 Hypothetical protein GL50803_27141 [Giardia lamblia ATCC 50803]